MISLHGNYKNEDLKVFKPFQELEIAMLSTQKHSMCFLLPARFVSSHSVQEHVQTRQKKGNT